MQAGLSTPWVIAKSGLMANGLVALWPYGLRLMSAPKTVMALKILECFPLSAKNTHRSACTQFLRQYNGGVGKSMEVVSPV